MSLSEAVLEIAEQMDAEAERAEDAHQLFDSMKDFAKELRLIVKAAGDEPATWQKSKLVIPDDPPLQQRIIKAVQREEASGMDMVELLDGTTDQIPEYHGIPAGMQPGMAIDIGRRVFVLRRLDNGTRQLHYHPEETAKRFPQKGGA